MNIAIIGSGVAGLTAGAALAKAGHNVTVFEQYTTPGGVTATISQDGFHWDLGQLMMMGFGPGEPVGDILADLGIAERVPLRREDRRYVFPDFDLGKPDSFGGPRWRMQRLAQLFPGDAKGLQRYWKDYLRFTRLMTIGRRLEGKSGLEKLSLQARLYATLLPFLTRANWSAQRLMDNYFTDDKLKCVFMSILADFFTPPSAFQGLGVFALNPETSFDCRIPAEIAPGAVELYHYSILGGIGALSGALAARIVELGGSVLTDHPVARINLENGKVRGVTAADGIFTPAEVVVATGAARETFFNLVGEEFLPADYVQKVNDQKLMDSVFMVHLGLNVDPSPHTRSPVVYYYGTYDLESGIGQAAEGVYHEGRDGFVVHVPTMHSPGMAPQGKHALTIYTICPDRLKDGSWQERREEFADKLVAYAEKHIPGLKTHTVTRVIITPDDFRLRTAVDHHAFGGLAPCMGSPRIPHQTPIPGLWFVGAQSESGGGINAVIPAAYKTARRIHLAKKD